MRDDHKRKWWTRGGRVVAAALGTFALVATVAFFARTRPVLGPVLRAELVEWAERRDVRLEVGAMRPQGLAAVRLRNVELGLARAGADVELHLDAVDLRPSLRELLAGRIAVGALRAANGEARLEFDRSAEDSPRAEAGSAAASAGASAGEAGTPAGASAGGAGGDLAVTIDEVDLRAGLPARLDVPPVHLEHAELSVDTSDGDFEIDGLEGFGRVDGGVSYSVTSTRPGRFRFQFDRPVAIGDASGTRLPLGIRFRGATACLECSPPRICLQGLGARRAGHRFESKEGCLQFGGEELRARSEHVEWFRRGEAAGIRVDSAGVRMRPSLLAGKFTVGATDVSGGRAVLEGRWDVREGLARATVEFSRFRVDAFWPLLGGRSAAEGGLLEGRVEADVDPGAGFVEVAGDLEIRDVAIRHRLVGDDPVELEPARVWLDLVSDLEWRHVNLVDTRVELGDAGPVELDGSLVDAGKGWAFEFGAEAERLQARRLREALPDRWSRPARGADLRGTLRGSMFAAGHTAYPESLRLEVDVGGDARVREESRPLDVTSLAASGPPAAGARGRRIPLSDWVAVGELPDVLLEVVLAAEDTRFYRHSGLDWRGIRRALVHDLREGRFERGGSTISQQVAKNLFFSHRRTFSRKIRELWATWRLESRLSKRRILELYLNLAEWGPGIRGLRSAAETYFGVAPEELDIRQMALLSAILPGPGTFGPLVRAGYLSTSRVEKVEHILNNLRFAGMITPEAYERIHGEVRRGRIGGLNLTVCRDDDASRAVPECPRPSNL